MDAVNQPSGGDDLRQTPPSTPNGESSAPAVRRKTPLRAAARILRALVLGAGAIMLIFAPDFMVEYWSRVEAATPFFDPDYWLGVGLYLLLSIGAVAIVYLAAAPKRFFKVLPAVILLIPLIGGALFSALSAVDANSAGGGLFAVTLFRVALAAALMFELTRANYKIYAPKFQFKWSATFATIGIWVLSFIVGAGAQLIIEISGPEWLTVEFYIDTNIQDVAGILPFADFGAIEWILTGAALCLLTPIAEELIFRRALMGGLIAVAPKRQLFVIGVVLFASLVFMAIHIAPYTFARILALALGLAAVYLLWGVRYAIFMHALQNATAFGLILLDEFGAFESFLIE